MPIYEYECEACGHRFELIQKFSDPSSDVCPTCGEHKVHKRPSSPAIQFKGSGFYINDYARKGTEGKEGTEPTPKPATKDSKESKSSPSDSSSTATASGSADTASPKSSPKDS